MIDYTYEVSYISFVLFRQDTYKEFYEFVHLTVGCICSFLFGSIKNYSYLCKKITYTPCYTQYFYPRIFIYKKSIMSKEMRNHIESFKNFKLNESNQIGKVYFNDEKYPGFMYVKEILPKYQMYWIGTETDEVIPTELVKDEEMDLYWLKSPDGKTFGYEIFKHKNGYFILDLIEPQELNKYLSAGGKWFPSDKG